LFCPTNAPLNQLDAYDFPKVCVQRYFDFHLMIFARLKMMDAVLTLFELALEAAKQLEQQS
jgi:hypothetical protein